MARLSCLFVVLPLSYDDRLSIAMQRHTHGHKVMRNHTNKTRGILLTINWFFAQTEKNVFDSSDIEPNRYEHARII